MSNRDYDRDRDREGTYGYDRSRYEDWNRGRGNWEGERPDLPWLHQRNPESQGQERFRGQDYGERYGNRSYGGNWGNEDYERSYGGRGYGSGYGEGFDRGGDSFSGSHERDYPSNTGYWSGGQGYGWRNRGYEGGDWQGQGWRSGQGRDWQGQGWRGWHGQGQDWQGPTYGAYGQGQGPDWQRSMYGSFGQGQEWRRQGRFSGMGPEGYQRSDDRIREDINDRLTEHGEIDATHVTVHVNNGEVTLTGDVDDRFMRRMAEDISDSVPGVRDVRNELKTGHAEHRNQKQQQHIQAA